MKIHQLFTRRTHENGAELQLLGLDNEKVDAFITLRGADAECWQQYQREIERAMIDDVRRSAEAARDKTEFTATDRREIELQALVNATISFRGTAFTDEEGNEIPFTKEFVESMYRESPLIRKQVLAFVNKRGNFTQG